MISGGGWPLLLTTVHFALATWVTIHAVLHKRDTGSAIAWTGLAWLAPYVGVFAYFCFGVNRIHRRAVRLGVQHALAGRPAFRMARADLEQARRALEADPELSSLAAVGRAVTGRDPVPGNSIEPLMDGDEIFPAMTEAIANAECSVSLMSYIFDNDRAGDAMVEALSAARARGIEVRVLIDAVGSRYSRVNMVDRIQEQGITAARFLPTRINRIPQFANLRNHRKILVVDGKTGFTGGANIREAHWLSLDPKHPTACVHFRLNGPVVEQLQEVFVTDWAFTTGEELAGEAWFPALTRSGDIWARGIAHGPDEDFESLSKVIFAALTGTRGVVRVVNPYFIPDSRLVEALAVAAMRGVRVEIYLPSNNNIPVADWAAAAQLDLLLRPGCKVFITRPPFDHSKLMVVDGSWALIGSTNWDQRSLRLNFEFNVECFDAAFVAELNGIIDAKAQGARQITLADIEGRPFPIRLRDGFARLVSPYL